MNNQTVYELNNRNLDNCYFSIICFSTKILMKDGDNNINSKNMYTFYGCNLLGVRKFIGNVVSDDFPKTSDWYNYLLKLKNRHLKQVLYVVLPNNNYLKDAFKLAFKDCEIFISCFEAINKLFKYYTSGFTTNIYGIIKDIYLSETIDDYELAVTKFNEIYGDSQFILDLLSSDIKNAKTYYSYNFILRKHIFSFYFYRDTFKRLITQSHSKDSFNNSDQFTELLLDIIKTNERKMYAPKLEWINVINTIYPLKKDLIKDYL